jgi:hypothetical protein
VNVNSAQEEEESTPPYKNWSHGLTRPPSLGRWTHYQVDLKLGGEGAATLSVTADGAPLLDAAVLGQAWPPGPYSLSFGLAWINGSSGTWSFHYDNVAVTVD